MINGFHFAIFHLYPQDISLTEDEDDDDTDLRVIERTLRLHILHTMLRWKKKILFYPPTH